MVACFDYSHDPDRILWHECWSAGRPYIIRMDHGPDFFSDHRPPFVIYTTDRTQTLRKTLWNSKLQFLRNQQLNIIN